MKLIRKRLCSLMCLKLVNTVSMMCIISDALEVLCLVPFLDASVSFPFDVLSGKRTLIVFI